MLHDKCVQFISAALDNPQERAGFIIKSQNILSQLQISLVRDDKIAQSLFYLYDYCYVLLERATDEDLNNAGDVVAVLRDTFRILSRPSHR
jgi:flagellin-specific chaperone FliS